jgi:HJR/Mrr/RecB family endonuclease
MDELSKKLKGGPNADHTWLRFSDRVNSILDLIDEGRLNDGQAKEFWDKYDYALTLDPDKYDSWHPKLNDFSRFCEYLISLIDPEGYLAPSERIMYVSERVESYRTIIVDESKRVKRIITDIYKDNSTLITLGSREFEEVIAELLAKQGFKVELTPRTKDGGYDIIALLNYKQHNPLKFLVECKRYNDKKVGIEVIRSFKHVVDQTNVNRGIIATTSYFTKGALDEQKGYPLLLDYRDKDKVLEWVKGYYNDTR